VDYCNSVDAEQMTSALHVGWTAQRMRIFTSGNLRATVGVPSLRAHLLRRSSWGRNGRDRKRELQSEPCVSPAVAAGGSRVWSVEWTSSVGVDPEHLRLRRNVHCRQELAMICILIRRPSLILPLGLQHHSDAAGTTST